MTEVVNLRLARKAKRRTDDEAKAAANRLLHGRTRGERVLQAAEQDRSRRLLDGARLEGDATPVPGPNSGHGD